MKKILALTALALTLALGAACGGGNDALSKVVGPNPISAAHELVQNVTRDGWPPVAVNNFQTSFRTNFEATAGFAPSQALVECATGVVESHYSTAELADTADTTSLTSTIRAITAQCGVR